MAGSMLAIFPILRPWPPVFTPPAARFKIEWVLIAIRGKLLSPSAISVPIEIPMESFNNFGIVQMGPDFSPVLRQIIITHSLVPRVLRLNHRQLRSCRFLGFRLLMYMRPQAVRHAGIGVRGESLRGCPWRWLPTLGSEVVGPRLGDR